MARRHAELSPNAARVFPDAEVINSRLGRRTAEDTEESPMADLKEKTVARLDEWKHKLASALERTHIEAERRRLQRQLADLSMARDQLDALGPDELARVYERLSRDPDDWIRHRMAS